MKSGAAARRYARALFSLSQDDGRVDDVRRNLARFAELLEQNAELQQALFRPLHPAKERRAVLASVSERLGVQPT